MISTTENTGVGGYREKALNHYEESCKICSSAKNVVVHHIDGDRSNNTLDNLLVVCRSCHANIHLEKPEFAEWHSKLKPHSELDSSNITTIGVSTKQRKTIKHARDQLEKEIGESLTIGDAVAKLARDYVGESA